jgi:hypothetical protein
MLEAHVKRVLEMLSPTDVVLDIGGWACPFNRANYVVDAFPYATRGFYRTFGGPASQGGEVEHFTEKTWIVRDLCDRAPFPFADKSLDFVICSQTLEDLRDPLWVCSEMVRVGKRGYLEVPSRAAESSRGWEHPHMAGLSHHRWLIDIEGSHLRFLMKPHLIHTHWRYSLPESYFQQLSEEQRNQWLFWEGSFSFEEPIIHGVDALAAELERFVQSVHPYPPLRLAADEGLRQLDSLRHRAQGKLKRTLRRWGA